MHLDPFELHRPQTVDETVALATSLGPAHFDYLAGGTDLLPNYKMHLNLKPNLVALWDVAELSEHSLELIGGMTRLADLEVDATFTRTYPGVAEAVRQVATPLVRASATVAGNLLVETRCFFFNQSFPWRQSLGFCLKADGDRCHVVPQKERCYATFSGDLAPTLLVLDAEVEVAGPGGRRRLPLASLYDAGGDGIQRHHLAAGDLLVGVHLPPGARGLPATYRKLRIRPSFDFPELGVALALRLDEGRVVELRLALGGLETYPRRMDDLTAPLVGQALTSDRIRQLADATVRAVRPVHNTFLDPGYRKKMTGVFVRRALEQLSAGRAA
ncbi:MAG: FAD binding domain-containing protein [Thermoplasmata archaeon]|nr:FAD binding domain-containing protein [Thermoplasmata archaeon]